MDKPQGPRRTLRLVGLGVLAAGLLSLVGILLGQWAANAAGCTANWTGAKSANWNTAGNWSPATVPGASSEVCMQAGAANTTLNIASGATGNAAGIDFTTGGLVVDGILNLGANGSSIPSLDVENQVNTSGASVNTVGTLTLDGNDEGIIDNADSSASLTVTGAGNVEGDGEIEGGSLIASGSTGDISLGTSSSSMTMELRNNAVLEATSGGTVTLHSNDYVSVEDSSSPDVDIASGGVIDFAATNSGDSASVDVPITLNGESEASNGGQLELDEGGSIGPSTFAVTSQGAAVDINSTFDEPSGEVGDLSGLTNADEGTLTGPGTYVVPAGATATLYDSEISATTVTVAASGTLDMEADNAEYLDNSAHLTVNGTLVFGASANLTGDDSSDLLTVGQAGTLSYPDTDSSDEAYIYIPMADDGTTNVAHAILDYNGAGSVGPSQSSTGEGVFQLDGTLIPTGNSASSVGSIAGIVPVGDSTFDGPGVLELPKGDSITWPSASLGDAVHIENFGNIQVPAGDDLYFNNGGKANFENGAGGKLTIDNNATVVGDSTCVFNNDVGAITEYSGASESEGALESCHTNNNGELESVGGGEFRIDNLVVSSTATAVNQGTSSIQPENVSPPSKTAPGNIDGLTFPGDSTISGPGTLDVLPGATSNLSNATLQGEIVLDIESGATGVVAGDDGLEMNDNAVIDVFGTLNMDNDSNIEEDSSGNEIVDEPAGNITYHGSVAAESADIEVPIVNNGTINAQIGTFTIYLLTATFTPSPNGVSGTLKTGTYEAGYEAEQGILNVSNTCQIEAGAVTCEGAPYLSTNDATLIMTSKGEIETESGTLGQGLQTNAGTIDSAATFSLSNPLNITKTLDMTAGTITGSKYTLSGNSTTTVAAGAELKAGSGAGALTLAAPATGQTAPILEGNGTVDADVTNNGGSVSPSAGTAGALSVSTFKQTPTTGASPKLTIAVDTAGTVAGTDYSQLKSTGAVTLGGTLALSSGSAYKPVAGASYTILSGSSVTGKFASVTGTAIGSSGDVWHLVYNATSVVIQVSPPTVTSVSPTAIGDGAKDAPVKLTGLGFATGDALSSANTGVTFSNVVVVSSTSLTADVSVSSTATAGATSVVVKPTSGTTFSCAKCLTIDAAAKVTVVSPNAIGRGITATVKITGTGFNSPATHPLKATVSGPATGVTATLTGAVSATSFELSVKVPATQTTGKYSITIVNGDYGTSACSSCLTIEIVPTISTFTPAAVHVGASGVPVTITGTNFESGAALSSSNTGVSFASIVVTTTKITAKMSVKSTATLGAVTLTVQDAGQGKATKAGAFKVDANPAPKSLSPASLKAGASKQTVKIAGTGFLAGAKVAFSPSTGITVTVGAITSTSISLTVSVTTTAKVQKYSVTVTNSDGGVGTCASCFSVTAAAMPAHASPGRVLAFPASGTAAIGVGRWTRWES